MNPNQAEENARTHRQAHAGARILIPLQGHDRRGAGGEKIGGERQEVKKPIVFHRDTTPVPTAASTEEHPSRPKSAASSVWMRPINPGPL